MLAVWGVVVVVSLGLTGTLLGSGLTSESSLTNHPESDQAQELIDARLSQQNAIDEVIVVRSERLVASDPAFAARVRALTAQARRSGAVEQITSYRDPGGEILVSAEGLTRLRAQLASDRDFAARALSVESGPRVAVASVPLTVEPSSECVGGD